MIEELLTDCNVIHEETVNKIQKIMPKEEMFIETSNFCKVLADKTRMKIVWALDNNELCVCDIAVICNMTKSAISHQLALLKKENYVKTRREGKEIFYSLEDEHVKYMLENAIEHIKERKGE